MKKTALIYHLSFKSVSHYCTKVQLGNTIRGQKEREGGGNQDNQPVSEQITTSDEDI